MDEIRSDNVKFVKIAKPEDLPDGERLFIEMDGQSIVLFYLNGEYSAIADECSHDQSPIGEGELDGDAIICPRHGARFNIHTGKVLSMPAVEDLQTYPVRINGEYIEVGIPQ